MRFEQLLHSSASAASTSSSSGTAVFVDENDVAFATDLQQNSCHACKHMVRTISEQAGRLNLSKEDVVVSWQALCQQESLENSLNVQVTHTVIRNFGSIALRTSLLFACLRCSRLGCLSVTPKHNQCTYHSQHTRYIHTVCKQQTTLILRTYSLQTHGHRGVLVCNKTMWK